LHCDCTSSDLPVLGSLQRRAGSNAISRTLVPLRVQVPQILHGTLPETLRFGQQHDLRLNLKLKSRHSISIRSLQPCQLFFSRSTSRASVQHTHGRLDSATSASRSHTFLNSTPHYPRSSTWALRFLIKRHSPHGTPLASPQSPHLSSPVLTSPLQAADQQRANDCSESCTSS
jgi:hypothetical protein